MSTTIETNKTNKYLRAKKILFLLLIISLPFGCCGSLSLLDMLPSSVLPPSLDFIMNLFEATASVENKTNQTLYITPISTIYGYPQVISQSSLIRQRDFPLEPNTSITLTYDSADMTLDGIIICRENRECKLLPDDNINEYKITSFEDLSELDPSWFSLVQTYPEKGLGNIFILVLIVIFSLAPIVLFLSWLYLGKLEKKQVH